MVLKVESTLSRSVNAFYNIEQLKLIFFKGVHNINSIIGFCNSFKLLIKKFHHVATQPRPQGAFPGFGSGAFHLQSRPAKAPWGRGWLPPKSKVGLNGKSCQKGAPGE